MHGAPETGRLPFLSQVGNLSAFLTLVAVVAIGFGAAQKLDSISAQAVQNCHAINSAILLTLEAGRQNAIRHHQVAELNRVEDRFAAVNAAC